MIKNSNSRNRKELIRLLSEKEQEIESLRGRVEEFEREGRQREDEGSSLEGRLSLADSRIARLHDSYLKRLSNQTRSTQSLSDTVNTMLGAVGEIAASYGEMSEAVRSVASVCRDLSDSFEAQARAQEGITRQTEAIGEASESESLEARELRTDLEHLEEMRAFMAQAMDSIADISDRLSLLSMNGRIEAAHAGAAGRGFAVVAQEMLNLQVESFKIISSQKARLEQFLPLMSAMQKKSDEVDAQAREQKNALGGINKDNHALNDQTRLNQERISGLLAAVEELAASIEQGRKTTGAIDEETAKVKDIFKEEVFVSQKVNSIDSFVFDVAKKARSLAEAGHLLVNEYQRISVLNGASYVWRAESWLVTWPERLPPRLKERAAAMGRRVLACIGQTENNRAFPEPLDPASGILELRPLSDIADRSSPLQALQSFLGRVSLRLEDLQDPRRIDHSQGHMDMDVIERFEGEYERAMSDTIRRGALACSFSFGGLFPNGDLLVNLFLSTIQRHHSDAEKYGMIGESMILAFQGLAENGSYWRG
ncbi:MAG: methyl-accepting chemotaxis protein [Treponema sp.]|nr:methyl-accepting chemotaxis protein [Treponema sp.]